MRKITPYLLLILSVMVLTVISAASTGTVLYNFCSKANCTDGANPQTDLVTDLAGNLWGTTRNGGANGFGEIFELTKSSGFTALGQTYGFKGGSADGAFPEAGLVFDSQTGFLYGTTSQGGTGSCSGGCGTIFEFLPGATTDTILHFFGSSGDGATPLAGLVLDTSQNLYGTTSVGGSTGCTGGCGTVFEMSPLSNTYKVLYKFTGGADGNDPVAALTFDSQGNLWGTAEEGGSFKFGTIFELAAPGFTSLQFKHSFKGTPNGASPAAALTFDPSVGGALGTLYGTTSAGGSRNCTGGCGLVFELEITGHVIKIVFKLNGAGATRDGAAPFGRLALDTNPNDPRVGHLYGTASMGGTNTGSCPSTGCGTLFEICPPTINCTGYARGTAVFHFDGTDGENPLAGVLLDVAGAVELEGGRRTDWFSLQDTDENGEPGPQSGKGACTTNCIGSSSNGGQNGKGVVVKVGP
ncbi:MAG TPA: choice-of-anchor tandem repeat GloVer-containing protein [Terriglobales bacterium]|nr:choice-of-anchor tandem repeat GloVer-containing protein [Terriglobales bacterium]